MEVAVSGSTGLIGDALCSYLRAAGHRPVPLVRRKSRTSDEIGWDPLEGTIDAASLDGIHAVVHLAGAGIGDRRWTTKRKRLIYRSRVEGTRLLSTAIAGLRKRPKVFVSGSAIGFYGSRGDETITESSLRGDGFLADLVFDWERSARPAVDAEIRTVFARTGIVLSAHGGTLAKQLPLFRMAIGGRVGPGTQWISWISLPDQARALNYLLDSALEGAVNLTAPQPVTNNRFTESLAHALHRPARLPTPLILPRLMFGSEMVDETILASQRIVPQALLADGFAFIHPTIDDAFGDLFAST